VAINPVQLIPRLDRGFCKHHENYGLELRGFSGFSGCANKAVALIMEFINNSRGIK